MTKLNLQKMIYSFQQFNDIFQTINVISSFEHNNPSNLTYTETTHNEHHNHQNDVRKILG